MKKIFFAIVFVFLLVTAACAGVLITTNKIPQAQVGEIYDFSISATGASSTTITWNMSGGKLPNGITLSRTGQFLGTPTEAGIFNFSVTVTAGSDGSDTKDFELNTLLPTGESTTELWKSVYALERGTADDGHEFEKEASFYNTNTGLICYIDSESGKYLDARKQELTEEAIANVNSYKYYKRGFTADGNTRLIIRAQVSRPGKITFSLNDDILELGAIVEDINRDNEAPKNGIPTVEISNGVYQASAVIVAPTNPYPNRMIPYPFFKIHLGFIEDGKEAETFDMPFMLLYSAPVALIHGLWGFDSAGTFGKNDPKNGLWYALERAGFSVFPCQYDGNFGPSVIIPETSNYRSTVIFKQVAEALRTMNEDRIASTRVDFVCHSLGGLMARQFIVVDEGNKKSIRSYGNGMVHRVVTIATPYRGSEIANFASGVYSKFMSKFNEFTILQVNNRNWVGAVLSMVMQDMLNDLIKSSLNISAQSLVDLSVDSVFLKKLWKKEKELNSDVPMHSIYGLVRSELGEVEAIATVTKVVGIGSTIVVSKIPGMGRLMKLLLKTLVGIGVEELTEQVFYQLFDALYSGQDYDISVPEASAHGDFADIATTRRTGHQYEHNSAISQKDNHARVIELLLSDGEEFQPFRSQLTYTEEELNVPENSYIGERLNTRGSIRTSLMPSIKITVDRNTVNVSEGTTQDVVVTATAMGDPIPSDSLYMLIDTPEGISKMIKVSTADGGKTFSVTLQLSEAEAGLLSVTCFAAPTRREVQNASNTKASPLQITAQTAIDTRDTTQDTTNTTDTDENIVTLYVSEQPAQIIVVPDIKADEIEELEFSNGFDTIFVNVGAELVIPLFAKMTDGKYYNVSSPAFGTSWNFSDSSIAGVTEAGNLKGVKEGTTTLTAVFMGKTATVNITVDDLIIVPIDEEHFPDEDFRRYINRSIDKNGDKYLSKGEIDSTQIISLATSKNAGYHDVKSLIGIKYFYRLTDLNCGSNKLTSLDVSGLTNLRVLDCSLNSLTMLNVGNCSSLEKLYCYSNSLTAIDVKNCPSLTALNCNSNKIAVMDVSGMNSLTELLCYSNDLTELSVNGCIALQKLHCYSNQLLTLNLESCSSLSELNCRYNNIEKLELNKNPALTVLNCASNDAIDLSIGNCVALEKLDCENNKLVKLDLNNKRNLTTLNCSFNNLTEINVSNCTSLNSFTFRLNDGLTKLDISGCSSLRSVYYTNNNLITLNAKNCSSLEEINCRDNKLTTLDVNGCVALKKLYCRNNSIPSIDLSDCVALKKLNCNNNMLNTLNVRNCSSLEELWCGGNNLTVLDISKCPNITLLGCSNNNLTECNIKGRSNLTYVYCEGNNLTELDASGCSSLVNLHCSNNRITELNVNGCSKLSWLACHSNNLRELNVRDCTKLTQFTCGNNQLMALDVSNSTQLQVGGGSQSVYYAKLKNSDGQSIFDFKDYISEAMLSNIEADSIQAFDTYVHEYDHGKVALKYKEGIVTFNHTPTWMSYGYNSGKFVMTVSVYFADKVDFEKPIITTTTLPSGVAGVSYGEFQLKATGTHLFWNAYRLPDGMKISYAGILSGKPLTAGTYNISIRAENGAGNDIKDFDLVISESPGEATAPVITTTSLPNGTIGEAYPETTLNATGTETIIWSWEGNYPLGLALTENGTIIGMPEIVGTFNFTVKAKNGAGETAKTLSITVQAASTPGTKTSPSITTTSLKAGTVGTAYEDKFTATGDSTADSPITWSKGSNWPTWLSLNESTGTITGTPTVASTYTVTVVATNEVGSDTKTLSIVINAASSGSTTDSPNAGGNTDATPDLTNPSANDAKPTQVKEMRSDGYKTGAYTEAVKTTSLGTEQVRQALGNSWSSQPLRSMESDMDQIDNRTDAEKEATLEELLEYVESMNNEVLYAFVLRPMRPKQSGVFTFALPLPSDMKVGHTLSWNYKRSIHTSSAANASVSSFSVSETSMLYLGCENGVSVTIYDEGAIFIDTATGNETKVVPASRAVSVSTYLEAGYEYEPVVMTVAESDNDDNGTNGNNNGGNNNNDNGDNGTRSSSGGGGCNSALFGVLSLFAIPTFPLLFVAFKKKR